MLLQFGNIGIPLWHEFAKGMACLTPPRGMMRVVEESVTPGPSLSRRLPAFNSGDGMQPGKGNLRRLTSGSGLFLLLPRPCASLLASAAPRDAPGRRPAQCRRRSRWQGAGLHWSSAAHGRSPPCRFSNGHALPAAFRPYDAAQDATLRLGYLSWFRVHFHPPRILLPSGNPGERHP